MRNSIFLAIILTVFLATGSQAATKTIGQLSNCGAASATDRIWVESSGPGDCDMPLSSVSTLVIAADTELAAIAGLTSAADRLPYFTGSGTASLATFTAAGRALIDDADATAQKVTLGLVIGTNVQAYDADLLAIAGLTSAADKGIQFTGSGTAAVYDLTTAGKALLDDADNTAQRTTLGLGTIATQAASAVTITGGSISGISAGGGSGTFAAMGAVSSQFTPVANVTTGETDFMSYTLPASSLSGDGKAIKVTAWGTGINNGNTKTVKTYVGGTEVNSAALLTSAAGVWKVELVLIRTGSSTQSYFAELIRLSVSSTDVSVRTQGTLSKTDTNTIIIKFTGTGGASNDLTQSGMLVEFLN